MAIGIASMGYVGIRREESFASGGAVTGFQPIVSESIVQTKNYFYPSQIMNSRQQQGGRLMNELASGSISFFVTPQNLEEWWRCGIGGSSSPYSPLAVNVLESMVVNIDRVTSDLYTSGDMITTMEFSSSNANALTCAVGIECAGFSSGDVGAATFTSDDDPFMHSEAVFNVGGVADDEITAFTVSVNNNNITDLYTGNRLTRREIPNTNITVTGSITRLFTDNSARNLFLANAQTSFDATFSRGSRSFKIDCAKINLESDDTPLSGFGSPIVETIPFTAQIDDVSADKAIELTVDTT